MKLAHWVLRVLLLCAGMATGVHAGVGDTYEDLKTADGVTYRGCTVTKVEPDGLTIMYSDGAVKIPFAKLPADIQRKYNFDSNTAEKYASEQASKRNAQIQANLTALDQAHDQKQKKQDQEKQEATGAGSETQNKASLNFSASLAAVDAIIGWPSLVSASKKLPLSTAPMDAVARKYRNSQLAKQIDQAFVELNDAATTRDEQHIASKMQSLLNVLVTRDESRFASAVAEAVRERGR